MPENCRGQSDDDVHKMQQSNTEKHLQKDVLKDASFDDKKTQLRQPLHAEAPTCTRLLERPKAGMLSTEDSDRLLKSLYQLLGAMRDQRAAFGYQVKQVGLLLRLLLPSLPGDLSDIAVLLEGSKRRHTHSPSTRHRHLLEVRRQHGDQAAVFAPGDTLDAESSGSSSFHCPDAASSYPSGGTPVQAVALNQSLALLTEEASTEALRIGELEGLKEATILSRASGPLSVDELAECDHGAGSADHMAENPRRHSCIGISYPTSNASLKHRACSSTPVPSSRGALKSSRELFEKIQRLQLMHSYIGNSQSTAANSLTELQLHREVPCTKDVPMPPNHQTESSGNADHCQLRSKLAVSGPKRACNSDSQQKVLVPTTCAETRHVRNASKATSTEATFERAGVGCVRETELHGNDFDSTGGECREELKRTSHGGVVSLQDICDRIDKLRSAVRLKAFSERPGKPHLNLPSLHDSEQFKQVFAGKELSGDKHRETGCDEEAEDSAKQTLKTASASSRTEQRLTSSHQNAAVVAGFVRHSEEDVARPADLRKQINRPFQQVRPPSRGEQSCRDLAHLMYGSVNVASHHPHKWTSTDVKAKKKERECRVMSEEESAPKDLPPAGLRSALAGGRDSGAVPPLRDGCMRERRNVSREPGPLNHANGGDGALEAREANAFRKGASGRVPSFCNLSSFKPSKHPDYLLSFNSSNLETVVDKHAVLPASAHLRDLQACSWPERSISIASQSSSFTFLPKRQKKQNPCFRSGAVEVSSPSPAESPCSLECAAPSANSLAIQKRRQQSKPPLPFWERLSIPKGGQGADEKRNALSRSSSQWNIQKTQTQLRRENHQNKGHMMRSTPPVRDTRGKLCMISANPVDECLINSSVPPGRSSTQETARGGGQREAMDVLAVRLRLELPGAPGQLMVRQVEDSLPAFLPPISLGDQCHPYEVGRGGWQDRLALHWPLQDRITVAVSDGIQEVAKLRLRVVQD